MRKFYCIKQDCEILVSLSIVPFSEDIKFEDTDELLILRLFVKKEYRGKGLAKQIMSSVCNDADKEKITLFIEPIPYDEIGLNEKELISFYKKLGFIDFNNGILKRMHIS